VEAVQDLNTRETDRNGGETKDRIEEQRTKRDEATQENNTNNAHKLESGSGQ